ncbi:hypothetical protein AMELA_G00276210 [Ameiurus melas]|uniref:Phosphatidylinositol-3-phosphate phosphatase n=1 Tax=Ameiurus melas TaxID=219545 RepID=A0A7J5ZMJ4_AMEME|nr:hypothetical protein AMELA_G00276210 [Ameiurus melas]
MDNIRTPKVEKVRLIDRLTPRRSTVGTLYLSSTHTIFVENSDTRKETWLLHSLISSVDRPPATPTGSPLILRCKNFQVFQFLLPLERECVDVQESLTHLSRPAELVQRPEKGTNEDHYTNIRLQFIGIENIHVMRSSQQKLIEVGDLRSPSMGDFLWGLENSSWLKHIKAVLDAGVFIAKAVAEEGVSVLVHCSDGWDRTAQGCSVASVLLDPYYRTIKGFMVLIEKDWVSFGHKFSHRYAHLDGDPKEVSPVLDQFLECVWQLMEQFPCAFEFNERFLLQLHTHVHSCQYGNFIGNSQRERRDLRIRERTHSLWPCLWEKRSEFVNPLFRSDHSQTQGVLRPLTTPYCFKFWKGMYSSAERGRASHQSPSDWLTAVKEESQQLEEELNTHEERLAQLLESRTRRLKNGATERAYRTLRRETEVGDAQDYFTRISRGTGSHAPSFTLPLKSPTTPKACDADDLSVCSDLESGVADLSSHASSSCDDAKDPHLDEAAYEASA